MSRRCPHCGAHGEQPPLTAAEAIAECMNCRVDISLRGQWTGDGWRIVQELVEANGRPAVLAAFVKAGLVEPVPVERDGARL